MDDNIYDNGGFYWWSGLVEDRMDPLYLGRCRIRIVGYHTSDKTQLPTADLPWALPVQPITSAATTGVGTSPVGPVEGTWVIGFFADGNDCQQPIFFGTFAGLPQREFVSRQGDGGFQDPNKKYPKRELLDEPDTNRLARNQKLEQTIVGKKKESLTKAVPIALNQTPWNQSPIPYSAKYPFNHVTETESGHVIELDDTPGSERIHVYHKKGSFVEVDANGTMVRKIIGDDYQILERNGFIYIKGKANVTIEGSCNLYVMNNLNMEIDGNFNVASHGNIVFKAGKKISLTAADDIEIHTAKKINISADGKFQLKAQQLNLYGMIKTTLASPITELAILKMNAFSITPTPPILPIIIPPTTIDSKSPTEPNLSAPGLELSPEDTGAFTLERDAAASQAATSPTAGEYAGLKTAELSANERASVATTEETQPNPDCAIAFKIVEIAKKDLNIIETGTAARRGDGLNYGGKLGGGELAVGVPGRIDAMLKNCGINNQKNYVEPKGEGAYWCAAAVTSWWKEAGLPTPPGPAACVNWANWAKKTRCYSKIPAVGAAVLYGPEGAEHHIGVVIQVNADGSIITIEGNTGGGGFNRNGCGCFQKKPNMKMISGYVLIPQANCDSVAPALTPEDLKGDIGAYIKKLKGHIEILPESARLQLPDVAEKFGINTPLRMAHFISQCAHESAGFRAVTETSLSGYSAKALVKTWPTHFPNEEMAKEYAGNAEKTANRAYENRMGNGPEASGDGWKYRGRGFIQLTGKSNYRAFRQFVPEDVVAAPDLVATKYPMLSAAWFWINGKYLRNGSKVDLNVESDKGTTPEVVRRVTTFVNGGINGLPDRQKRFDAAISLA